MHQLWLTMSDSGRSDPCMMICKRDPHQLSSGFWSFQYQHAPKKEKKEKKKVDQLQDDSRGAKRPPVRHKGPGIADASRRRVPCKHHLWICKKIFFCPRSTVQLCSRNWMKNSPQTMGTLKGRTGSSFGDASSWGVSVEGQHQLIWCTWERKRD